jgi:hypothetical protein
MADQVVTSHPNSAKAHYVKAEIAARQRDTATARSELQAAERIAPGLPFAKPEAVSALRAEIDRTAGTRTLPAPRSTAPAEARRMGAPPAQGGGFPFGSLLLVAVIAAAVVFFLRMRRLRSQPPMYPQQPPLEPGFGRYDAPPQGPGYGGYPPGGYPPQYPQQYLQQGPSMGSSIARGVATGLAVGAGAVAAQEIGRRMFDHDRPTTDGLSSAHTGGSAADSSLANDAGIGAFGGDDTRRRNDFGGDDFGIVDNGGWDDGGGGGDFGMDDSGGGSDDWNT